MRFQNRLIFPFLLTTAFIFVILGTLFAHQSAVFGAAPVLSDDDTLDVIVTLQQPDERGFETRALAVAALQEQVVADLDAGAVAVNRRFEHLSALALTLDADSLAQLQADTRVLAIEPDLPLQPHLEESVLNTGAKFVHDHYRITGKDVPVAILDSGLQGNHSDFSVSRTIGQQCFTDGDCAIEGSAVLTDTGDSAEDTFGHGTNVTGIIASNGTTTVPGFAPESLIISIRILDKDGNGRLSDLIAGLDWLNTNPGFNVKLVNMSVGVSPSLITSPTLHTGTCDTFSTAADTVLTDLIAKGFIFFASAGNDGSDTQIAFPACHSSVIAVGATYDSELARQPSSGTYFDQNGAPWADCFDETADRTTVACFSNSNDQVQLVAPGVDITSSGLVSTSSTFGGTSQAAATVTGIAALLLEADPTLDRISLLNVLTRTATVATDRNDQTFPLVNAKSALDLYFDTVFVPIAVRQ